MLLIDLFSTFAANAGSRPSRAIQDAAAAWGWSWPCKDLHWPYKRFWHHHEGSTCFQSSPTYLNPANLLAICYFVLWPSLQTTDTVFYVFNNLTLGCSSIDFVHCILLFELKACIRYTITRYRVTRPFKSLINSSWSLAKKMINGLQSHISLCFWFKMQL